MTATRNEPVDIAMQQESNVDGDPIIEVRNTNVRFEMDRGTSHVLRDVNIDIVEDEILGIVGESGSGKSMFASALLDAVIEPGILTGDITYHGENEPIDILSLSDEELRRLRWEGISFVFQGAMSSFNPTMTIRGHFLETLQSHNEDRSEGMEHARELLSELYLDPDRVLDSYPHELSGGMSQRALIALSMLLNPDVLVMDEPTAALDLLMQRSILSLLENLKEIYDLTIVFITHDLPLVAGLADRLAVLYAFQFVEIGPASEITDNSGHPYTRALLNSVPSLDIPISQMKPIEGDSPDPIDELAGCSYAPRCPLSIEECSKYPVSFEEVSPGHQAACIRTEDAQTKIELAHLSSEESVASSGGSRTESQEEVILSLSDVDVHFEESDGLLSRLISEPDIVHAVDNVDLDLEANDVIALVGESGCGKTTLGKTAIGVQRPTNGSVTYKGQDIWESRDGQNDPEIPFNKIRHALQMIPQDPGSSLNPNRTVEATLHDPIKQSNPELDPPDRHARILSMLTYAGMTPAEDYAKRYPHQLSGGEKQRVALIRALLMNPDVILADEAVSALDVSLRVEMMNLMIELQEYFDTSYIFISHTMSNARYLAEKSEGLIGVMYLGEIVEIGQPREIITNPQHPYTKVLMWASETLDEGEDKVEEPPIRDIDIPDPVDPPAGCRFHTRCPEAHEVCQSMNPQEIQKDGTHQTACFRVCDDDHEYWESEPLYEDERGVTLTEMELEQ